jgi:hypothetical protein
MPKPKVVEPCASGSYVHRATLLLTHCEVETTLDTDSPRSISLRYKLGFDINALSLVMKRSPFMGTGIVILVKRSQNLITGL